MQNNNQRPRPQRQGTQRPPQNPNAPRGANNTADYARRRAAYERRKAYEAEMERRRKAERKRAREVFARRFVLFLIILGILAVIAAVGFWIHFNRTNEPSEPLTVRYTYGGADGGSLSTEEAYRDGVLYMDFTAAAEYLGMSQVGGADGMRFIIPVSDTADSAGEGTEEEVILYENSDLAHVNGQNVRMDGAASLKGEHFYVPLSFFAEYVQGASAVVSENGRSVAVSRTFTDEIPDALGFTLKREKPVEPIPEDTSMVPGVTTTPDGNKLPEPDITVVFKSDLSAYEKYMNPENRDEYLILVNYENLLDEKYLPADLTNLADTRKDGRNTQKMVKTAAMALEAMFIELRANGYTDVSVTSAYRSYSYQKSLFNMYTDNEMKKNPSLTRAQAEAITETYSARPGTSEHQTGLCCDMHNLSSADVAFANKDAYKWLKDNAWKFGFIIRFPEDKQDITKISFEPWHYRFVGRYHAKAMYDAGLCLEEYVKLLRG
ncbi:MAG: hypothetical protein E7662_11035 [Ruminococcaceae bacterium]|nr:hypothetical protein [Oscillospiraceae bacterium]